MNNCVFCKIISGEINSVKFYEDSEVLGIVDLFPRFKFQVLFMPKIHVDSRFSETNLDLFTKCSKVAQSFAKKIEKLNSDILRCEFVVQGLEVPHLHIRIQPLSKNSYTKEFLDTKFDGSQASLGYMNFVSNALTT